MYRNAQLLNAGTMDLLSASYQTYSADCSHLQAQHNKSKNETAKATQELVLHMRSCEQCTQRFNHDTDALKIQITDLTKSTSGGRQLSEAAHRLNQVNNDVRSLKLAIEQKEQTIDQLRTNNQALARRQTLGTSGASPQVNSGDPLTWPIDHQDRVLSRLNAIRLTNPRRPVSSPNFGDFKAIPAELPIWTPEGFVWSPVGNTALRVGNFRDVSTRNASLWTTDTVREVEGNLPHP